MESIIKFLEQYWGQSLVGTITLGTLVTFIVTQIKTILKDRVKNAAIDTAVSTADNLCNELNERDKRREAEMKEMQETMLAQQQEMAQREAYFENVLAATFQAISYLTIASKLPTEEKIALQKKFTTILNSKTVEYKEMLKDEVQAVKDEVVNNIIPDAKDTVQTTVEETKSLLDKYMKEG